MSKSDVFCDVIDNALLHLYLTVTETTRYTPIPKRNETLIRYLKPFSKDETYRGARKEIKTLLALGRAPGCNLEAKLVELHELSRRYDQSISDAKRLFIMLDKIEDELSFPARFIHCLNGAQPKKNTLYMLQEHIENGFVESGEQVAPVSLFLESANVAGVIEFINASGLFFAELQQMNEGAEQGHIVLHPPKKQN